EAGAWRGEGGPRAPDTCFAPPSILFVLNCASAATTGQKIGELGLFRLINSDPQHGAGQFELADRLAQSSACPSLVAISASDAQLFQILSRHFRMRDNIRGLGKT